MKPTKIHRSVRLPDFSSIAIDAEVEEGETIDEADLKLRVKLSELIDDENHRKDLVSRSKSLKFQIKELEEDLKTLQSLIDKNKQALQKAGVEVPILQSEIPF